MNILVILPPVLYDVVCSTALLRCVHQQVNGAQLHVVVPQAFAHALAANPHIARLVPTTEMHTTVSPQPYDLVIDVAHLEENEHWAAEAGIRYLSFPRASIFKSLFNFITKKADEHTALEAVAIAKPLGVQYDGGGLEYFISATDQVPQQDIPVAHSAGFVALVLNNSMPLHSEVLRHFCKQLQFPIMVTGSKEMSAFAQDLAAVDNVKVYNACGKFSDGETADLLNRSRLVVASDPGWIQVAAALGKPVVAWYANKKPAAELVPFYPIKTIQEKGQPFALLHASNTALASSTNAAHEAERAATGARLVHLVNELLYQK